ncbi:MAG: glycosyl transferase family 51, partial [Proteobacteria bacterium]|nr:glycosyl transferase family 51 [Pseudomonadota bacterium]
VPLSAAPGYGEVNGLGDGLFVWYGTPFDEMNRLLNLREPRGDELKQQARVIKQVISLMIAHRRPSFYLVQGRGELSELCNAYVRLLAEHNILSAAQSTAAQAQPLDFRNFSENTATPRIINDKGVNVVRNRLGSLFDTSLYALDRMDISVTTTLNSELQAQVSSYLNSLAKPEVAEAYGLFGKSLLNPDQADDLSYSFTLFERTALGNMVRVQTDTTQLPFDINEGSKLELGSTAKLRTLATYLQIMAELHHGLSSKSPGQLTQLGRQAGDPLTLWVVEQLQQRPDLPLEPLLEAAMARRYSANPGQVFFTGGGVHIFENFSKQDNNRIVSVTEALQFSINLPFVRIMADLVKYCREQRWPNSNQLIRNDKDPRQEEVLKRFIDQESRRFLEQFWNQYKGLDDQQRWERVLAQKRPGVRRLTIFYRQFFPGAGQADYIKFIRGKMPTSPLSDEKLVALYEKYAPGNFGFQDLGYLAGDHPLELWLLAYLQQEGEKSLGDAMAKSRRVRHEIYAWLMHTKVKEARKSRVRMVLEQDAFADIHRRWKGMGYPFDYLVPSLGSALGSSGDRPAALAELMGIILNDGNRVPTHRFTRVEFAKDTPYETIVESPAPIPVRVLYPEVARVLKAVLGKVVSEGTANRLNHSFYQENGELMTIGGKTGTGDNRIFTSTASGVRSSSQALNRTATFVFYIGDNHFGTLTTFVTGRSANGFGFTSALVLQVLKGMVPILQPYINGANGRPATD